MPISVGVAEKDMPDSFKKVFDLHKEMYALAKSELRPGYLVADIERKLNELAATRDRFGEAWALQSSELDEANYSDADLIELRDRVWSGLSTPGQHLHPASRVLQDIPWETLSSLPIKGLNL